MPFWLFSHYWTLLHFCSVDCQQRLSFSGFTVLSRQLGTLKKQGWIKISGIFRSGSQSFRKRSKFLTGIPSLTTIQSTISQSEFIFSPPEFPVVLNTLKSQISQFRVPSCFEPGRIHDGLTEWPMYSTISGPWCCLWMFILLSSEKRPFQTDVFNP
jgi:hypothetical protein